MSTRGILLKWLPDSKSPKSQTPASQVSPPRHVILPFNLRQDRVFSEHSELLSRLFPDTKAVWFDGYFLVFWLHILPPKPWPVTVAGIQPYFTLDPNDGGPTPPIKRSSKCRLRVSPNINTVDLFPEQIDGAFKLVIDWFTTSEVSITEVHYWDNFFVIVLEHEDTDLVQVPRSIGRCNCFYLFESEMERPHLGAYPALRIHDPTDGVVDDSEYAELRPGVMLSSASHPATHLQYRTTSGVLVENRTGERYMTVSSHGFPVSDRAFHPIVAGKDVGQIIMEILHTDVGLVKLHDEISFVNETFESPLDGVAPTKLKGFTSVNNIRINSNIYMNNPFTGYSEGTSGPHVRLRVPSGSPDEPGMIWIRARWLDMGQGFSEQLQDGICGSAIWNDDGNVLGFFRYAPRSGHFLDWCLVAASNNIIKRGFKVAA